MSPPLEASVEEDLRKAVEKVGGLCIKLPALLYRGIPDRMVLLPGGRLFFVELKRSPKARTKSSTRVHQDRFRKILLNLGFICLKIEGRDQLEEFISTHVCHP